MLENRNITDEERISQLEKELEETILLGEESDRKFEEVSVCPCYQRGGPAMCFSCRILSARAERYRLSTGRN